MHCSDNCSLHATTKWSVIIHAATATVPKMDSYINFVYSYNLPLVMLFDYLNWDFVNIYRDGLVNVTLMVPIVPQLFGDNWNHPVLIKKKLNSEITYFRLVFTEQVSILYSFHEFIRHNIFASKMTVTKV